MRKAATIFLLVLLVSLQTPLGQFFKLPFLIEHYVKHQRQEGVTLFAFLEAHYASNHKDTDLPEDENLPFKNWAVHSIGYAIVTPVAQPNVPAAEVPQEKIAFAEAHTPQQHFGSVFHPPRA